MPVCHQRQDLTALEAEDDLSPYWSHVLLS